jgi:hypothetical protein
MADYHLAFALYLILGNVTMINVFVVLELSHTANARGQNTVVRGNAFA